MDERDEFWLSEEMAEWIGLKKSEYLSKLIENMAADDFGFEDFPGFEHLVPGTISHPDRVFDNVEDGQRVRTYVRTYEDKMHQVVLGALVQDAKSKDDVFVPILIFVTKVQSLALAFSKGKVSGPLLN